MKKIAVILLMLFCFSGVFARMVTNDLKLMKIEGTVKQMAVAVRMNVPTYLPDGTNYRFSTEEVFFTNVYRFDKSGYMTEKVEYILNGKVSTRYTWEYTNAMFLTRQIQYRDDNPVNTALNGYANDFKTVYNYTLSSGDKLLDSIENYDDDGAIATKVIYNRYYDYHYTISNVYNDRHQLKRSYSVRDEKTTIINDYNYDNGLLKTISNFNKLDKYFLSEKYEYDAQGRETRDEEYAYMPYTQVIYLSDIVTKTYDQNGKIRTYEYYSQNGKNLRKVFEYDGRKNILTVKYFDLELPGQEQPYRVDRYAYQYY